MDCVVDVKQNWERDSVATLVSPKHAKRRRVPTLSPKNSEEEDEQSLFTLPQTFLNQLGNRPAPKDVNQLDMISSELLNSSRRRKPKQVPFLQGIGVQEKSKVGVQEKRKAKEENASATLNSKRIRRASLKVKPQERKLDFVQQPLSKYECQIASFLSLLAQSKK